MTAPAAVGTPSAANPTVAAEPISAASHGLDAVLGDLSDVPAETSDDAAPLEGEETAETPETETEPVDKARKLDDEVIFSDEALQTPEGIAKARSRIKDLRRLSHEKYLELKNYESRVVKRATKLKHQVDQYKTQRQNDYLLINNVRSNLQATHSGDPDQILTGLGALTGMDGLKALELLNSRLIHRGQTPLDPQVQNVIDSLRNEITELKGGFVERETQAKVQQLGARIDQHKQAIGQRITGNAQQMPHLARLYADNPEGVTEYIVDEITAAHKIGRPLDGAAYFGNLEKELARHFNPGAPQGDGGGPAPKQPSQAQRSPGQSVGPRTTSVSNPRVPTEEEILRSVANDSDLLSSLGL
jgi:hypothetical protein